MIAGDFICPDAIGVGYAAGNPRAFRMLPASFRQHDRLHPEEHLPWKDWPPPPQYWDRSVVAWLRRHAVSCHDSAATMQNLGRRFARRHQYREDMAVRDRKHSSEWEV